MKFLLVLVIVLSNLLGLANGKPEGQQLLKGVVVDSASGDALAGVRIEIKNSGEFVYSNKFGEFELPIASKESVELAFSFVSFEPLVLNVNASESKESLSIFLTER